MCTTAHVSVETVRPKQKDTLPKVKGYAAHSSTYNVWLTSIISWLPSQSARVSCTNLQSASTSRLHGIISVLSNSWRVMWLDWHCGSSRLAKRLIGPLQRRQFSRLTTSESRYIYWCVPQMRVWVRDSEGIACESTSRCSHAAVPAARISHGWHDWGDHPLRHQVV